MMTRRENLLVFSIALEGFEQQFADCLQTQVDYCRRHRYRYVLVRRAPRRLSREEAAWLKVPLLRAALDAGYDWVAFLDADCEIRPHTPALVEYLSTLPQEKTLFMAPGFSGRINSGVIFVKNDPESQHFFDTLLEHADMEVPIPEDRAPYENGHFIYFGKTHPAVHLLPHDEWNNNSHRDDRSYIQHYVRGPMRGGYLAERAGQAAARHPLRALLDRGRDAIFSPSRDEPPPVGTVKISDSLQNLMPYFIKKYKAFRSA